MTTIQIIPDDAEPPFEGRPFMRISDAEYAVSRLAENRDVFGKAADYSRLVEALRTAADLLGTLAAAHRAVVMDTPEDVALQDQLMAQIDSGLSLLRRHVEASA